MDFWIKFWTFFFFASLTLFAGLAIVITIGGFFDIRSLFKNLTASHQEQDKAAVETEKEV